MAQLLVQDPREIRFTIDDEVVSPEEVFQRLYSGLSEVIRLNLSDDSFRKRGRMVKEDTHLLEKRKKLLAHECLSDRLEATIIFDDNTTKRYSVSRRTDHNLVTVIKEPNVAFLRDKANPGSIVVLREARKYNLDFINLVLGKLFSRKFDYEATVQFYRDDEQSVVKPEVRNNMVMHIPEPHLALGLEKAYRDRKVPRITPKAIFISATDDKLWYLRDFLAPIVDAPPDPVSMGRYLGIVHTLGLIESTDRQMIHYCYDGTGKIVNYDVDAAIHTLSEPATSDDLRRFTLTAERESTGWFRSSDGNTQFFNDLKKYRNEMIRHLEKEHGVDKKTLIGYLSKNIDISGESRLVLATK